MTMSDGASTEFVTECSTPTGADAALTVTVDAGGRFELSATTTPVVLSAEQVAHLRAQLGEVLTVGLRDSRTCRGRSA
jgi:hypothetical protein